jgi:hypothetical protein
MSLRSLKELALLLNVLTPRRNMAGAIPGLIYLGEEPRRGVHRQTWGSSSDQLFSMR